MSYKFCPNCGNKLDGPYKFCPGCGFSLSESKTEETPKAIYEGGGLVSKIEPASKTKGKAEFKQECGLLDLEARMKVLPVVSEATWREAANLYRLLIDAFPDDIEGYYGLVYSLSHGFVKRDLDQDLLEASDLFDRFLESGKSDDDYASEQKKEKYDDYLKIDVGSREKAARKRAFLEKEYGLWLFNPKDRLVKFGYAPWTAPDARSGGFAEWQAGEFLSEHIRKQSGYDPIMRLTLSKGRKLLRNDAVFDLVNPISWKIIDRSSEGCAKGTDETLLTLMAREPLFFDFYNVVGDERYENSLFSPRSKAHQFMLEYFFTEKQRSLLVEEEGTGAYLRMPTLKEYEAYKGDIFPIEENSFYDNRINMVADNWDVNSAKPSKTFFLRGCQEKGKVYCVDEFGDVSSVPVKERSGFLPIIKIKSPFWL